MYLFITNNGKIKVEPGIYNVKILIMTSLLNPKCHDPQQSVLRWLQI